MKREEARGRNLTALPAAEVLAEALNPVRNGMEFVVVTVNQVRGIHAAGVKQGERKP